MRNKNLMFCLLQIKKLSHHIFKNAKEFSEYFLYFNNINEKELFDLLKNSHYGLELRDSKNFNSNIDLSSKLITYLN